MIAFLVAFWIISVNVAGIYLIFWMARDIYRTRRWLRETREDQS